MQEVSNQRFVKKLCFRVPTLRLCAIDKTVRWLGNSKLEKLGKKIARREAGPAC